MERPPLAFVEIKDSGVVQLFEVLWFHVTNSDYSKSFKNKRKIRGLGANVFAKAKQVTPRTKRSS